MVVTLELAGKRMQTTLHGAQIDGSSVVSLANRAGRYLVRMHPWKWCVNMTSLDLRPSVTFENATWNESAKTLTKTGAFASYEFVPGDAVRIDSGTNVKTKKRAEILSKTDNALTLRETIVTDGGNPTDVDGKALVEAIALPSDLRQIVSYASDENLLNDLEFVDLQTVLVSRETLGPGPGRYIAAVSHGWPNAGGAPTKRLELSPAVDSADYSTFRIAYAREWVALSGDQDKATMPEYMDDMYLELCAIYARGLHEEDEGSLMARLNALEGSAWMQKAMDEDGTIQPDHGMITNGAAQGMGGFIDYGSSLTVLGP